MSGDEYEKDNGEFYKIYIRYMPSVSRKQQNFFRLVKAYKNGKIKKKDVSQSIVDAANGMTKKQISHFADHRVKNTR